MKLFTDNQVTDGHLHAWCLYERISWRHFLYLFASIVVGMLWRHKSVTTHLPLELQHRMYPDIIRAKRLIRWGMFLARLMRVKLYWENAPLLNYGTWDLKHGQMDWSLVPDTIPLCLDSGHVMLGTKSAEEAREAIQSIFEKRKEQIRHLHIHENDLVHDKHEMPREILTKELLAQITEGRTYIYEK